MMPFNHSVSRADENYVNMLRDSRLQIRISELGGSDTRAKQVDLTLISLDKLMAWKLRDGPSDPYAWIELIDQMERVAIQNVQILSSIILTLLAARDYTCEVVDLVTVPPTPPHHATLAFAAHGDGVPTPAKPTSRLTTLAQSKKAASMR